MLDRLLDVLDRALWRICYAARLLRANPGVAPPGTAYTVEREREGVREPIWRIGISEASNAIVRVVDLAMDESAQDENTYIVCRHEPGRMPEELARFRLGRPARS